MLWPGAPLVALPQQQAVRLISSRLTAYALTQEGRWSEGEIARWRDSPVNNIYVAMNMHKMWMFPLSTMVSPDTVLFLHHKGF